MHKLSGDTVRLISSAQVITSISSVVKELIENSLDAHADNIEVRLENFGVDKVEVRDNGDGIPASEAAVMGQRHFTSKLSKHEDLDSLVAYGFRGEALGSLCAVSNVVIATRTKEEEVGRCYSLNQKGEVTSSKPVQCGTGTTVTATKLFHNVPVRKQYYSNAKRRKEELKKVEDLLLSFGVVCPRIRFSLSHNRSPIWQKNKAADLKSALLNTVGFAIMNQLARVERSDAESQVNIEGFLPKLDADIQLVTRATDDRSWTSVNGRPVILKDLTKVIKQHFSQAHPKAGNIRHLVMCLAVTMPTHLVDVNLEPNKTKVLLQNKDTVLSLLIQILEELYKPPPSESDVPLVEPPRLEYDKGGNSNSMPGNDTGSLGETSLGLSHLETDWKVVELQNSESHGLDVPQMNFQSVSANASKMDSLPNGQRTSESLESRLISETESVMKTKDVRSTETETEDSIMEPPLPNFSLLDFDEDLLATCPSAHDAITRESEVSNQTSEHCLEESTPRKALSEELGEKESLQESSTGDALPNAARDLARLTEGSGSIPVSKLGSMDREERTSSAIKFVDHDEGTENRGALDWSKGCALTKQSGENVQPSVLLIPGKHSSRNCEGPSVASLNAEREDVQQSSASRELLQTSSNEQVHIMRLDHQTSRSDGQPVNEGSSSNLTNKRTGGDLSANQIPVEELWTSHSKVEKLSTNHIMENLNKEQAVLGDQNFSNESAARNISTNQSSASEVSSNQSSAGGLSTNQSPGKLKRPMEDKMSPGSQYDLVGKAPVKRPQDAFAFFIKERKPEILRQHPYLDFAAVNKALQNKWEQLDEVERERFEELQDKDLQRYKDQVVCAKHSLVKKDAASGLPAKKKKKMDKLSNQSLIDEMLASQRERKRKATLAEEQNNNQNQQQERLERRLPFSIGGLKHALKPRIERPANDDNKGGIRLVGSLPGHGIWLAIRQGHVTVFNQYRAQEVLLYHRLLANHRLPCQKLPVPIVLSSSMFGDERNWFTLLGMRSQVMPIDQSRHFTDDRLLMNGFEIRQLVDPETKDARLEVISMATDALPFYGLDDLKEIVETVATQGTQKVMECRPLKLVNYLMGEAVRMARSLPAFMPEEDVMDIVQDIEGLTTWKSHLCLHAKSFMKDIYKLPDLKAL